MTTKADMRRIIKQAGGAKKVHTGLRDFSRRVRAFNAIRPQLIKQYPDKWVAMYNGEIAIAEDSREYVLEEMDRRGIPREATIIRFMASKPKSMVL